MKHLKFLVLTLAMLASVCFISSCSDDKDDKKVDGIAAQLVGTWKQSGRWGYELLTFDKDGTGILVEYDYEDGKDIERFTWSVKGSTLTMHSGDEYEIYKILSIDAVCLITQDYDDEYDDDIERWYKQ